MDISTISMILYFFYPVSMIAISIYVSRNKEMTLENYFLSNRSTNWLVLGISLLITSFFSPYLLGMAAAVSVSGYSILFVFILIAAFSISGWLLIPALLKTRINTLPEYFENRFSKNFRLSVSTFYVISNVFIRLVVILVAGKTLIHAITGIDAYSSILFFLVISGICVIIGGLKAEIYTNLLQAIIITTIVAGFAGWILSRNHINGFTIDNNQQLFNFSTVSDTGSSAVSLLFALPVIGFGFWCADQFIVQKVISAANTAIARKAVFTTGLLQIIPAVIIAAAVLYINKPSGISPNQSLFNLFSNESIPDVLRGGLLIAVASILMASFSNLFNSTSALITFDFYRHFRSESSDRKLVLVGRMSTMILLFISIIILLLTHAIDLSFCFRLFKLFSYTISAVAAIFAAGVFIRKVHTAGALLSLCLISTLVLVQTIAETAFNGRANGNLLFNWFINPGYPEFTVLVFLLSFVLAVVLSSKTAYKISDVLKPVLIKVQYQWNAHRTAFLVLSVLIMIAIFSIILI